VVSLIQINPAQEPELQFCKVDLIPASNGKYRSAPYPGRLCDALDFPALDAVARQISLSNITWASALHIE
jgi:hypothetical protein